MGPRTGPLGVAARSHRLLDRPSPRGPRRAHAGLPQLLRPPPPPLPRAHQPRGLVRGIAAHAAVAARAAWYPTLTCSPPGRTPTSDPRCPAHPRVRGGRRPGPAAGSWTDFQGQPLIGRCCALFSSNEGFGNSKMVQCKERIRFHQQVRCRGGKLGPASCVANLSSRCRRGPDRERGGSMVFGPRVPGLVGR